MIFRYSINQHYKKKFKTDQCIGLVRHIAMAAKLKTHRPRKSGLGNYHNTRYPEIIDLENYKNCVRAGFRCSFVKIVDREVVCDLYT